MGLVVPLADLLKPFVDCWLGLPGVVGALCWVAARLPAPPPAWLLIVVLATGPSSTFTCTCTPRQCISKQTDTQEH